MLEWSSAVDALKKSDIPEPVHVLVGTDFILSRWYIERLRQQLQRDASEQVGISRFRFDEEGCDAAIQTCETLSLFAETEIVHLDHCSGLLASGKTKHDLRSLETYLESPMTGKVLVITVYGEKMDERKKAVKLTRKHTVVDCNPPKEAVAIQRIHAYCKEQGLTMAGEAVSELWRRTQSLSTAVSELDKLAAFTAGAGITLKDVKELISLPVEDNVFAWIDGVVKGNVEQSFRVLGDIRRAGYDTFALYALIARQLRLMWYAKVLGSKGYSNQQIASKAGAHPYAVKVAGEQAKWLTQQRLERLLALVADAEFAVKSGRRDANQSLDWVVMACSTAR